LQGVDTGRVTAACALPHSTFAVLIPPQAGLTPAYVELDGCHRVLRPTTASAKQALPLWQSSIGRAAGDIAGRPSSRECRCLCPAQACWAGLGWAGLWPVNPIPPGGGTPAPG
jgi:hypothetical protein